MSTSPIEALLDAVRPIVEAIERETPTTQYRYDLYMSAIARLSPRFKGSDAHLTAAVLLLKAGGNKLGILHALKAMGSI
jgi:hypothetical protein